MTTKLPNIIILLITGVLVIAIVYFYFRTREKIEDIKDQESGNWLTNLFK